MLLTAAALGYQKWLSFSWGDPFLCYPMNDPNGVAKAVNDVHVNVAGKTIKTRLLRCRRGGELAIH